MLEDSEVIKEACVKSKLGIEDGLFEFGLQTNRHYVQVFRAIGLLKRLCNHPLLLLLLGFNRIKLLRHCCAAQHCLRPMPTVKDWANLLQEASL